jgi:hypothetical protein
VNVYWTTGNAGTVLEQPLAGGAVTTLASGQSAPSYIAVDATNVYFTDDASAGAVVRVPIAGGSPVTLVSGVMQPGAITLDATAIYYLTGSGAVMKLAK